MPRPAYDWPDFWQSIPAKSPDWGIEPPIFDALRKTLRNSAHEKPRTPDGMRGDESGVSTGVRLLTGWFLGSMVEPQQQDGHESNPNCEWIGFARDKGPTMAVWQ